MAPPDDSNYHHFVSELLSFLGEMSPLLVRLDRVGVSVSLSATLYGAAKWEIKITEQSVVGWVGQS